MVRDIICPYLTRTPEGKFYCKAKEKLGLDKLIDPAWNPCLADYRECPYYKRVNF